VMIYVMARKTSTAVYLCVYRSMDGLERSVRLGLVALAVSDMMFCFLYLTTRLLPSIKVKYSPYDSLFSLYFQIYHEVRGNIHILSYRLLISKSLKGLDKRYFVLRKGQAPFHMLFHHFRV
jgi:hypothetical protein